MTEIIEKKVKTKEEILEQLYISPQDLKILIPTMGIGNCLNCIKEVRAIMKEKNYYVPQTKPMLALTKIVRKELGI